jgi:hypothetical protein
VTGAQADSSRDTQDVDALVIDQYIESILAAHGRGADMAPTVADRHPDPYLRLAAERLARDLPRFHPSFRFEEALSGKLAEAAARMRPPLGAGGERVVVPLAGRDREVPIATVDTWVTDDPRPAIGHPLLIGGALTSAALSLAGAAYVAWRVRHPQAGPMARAVRAVARTRLA